LSYQWSFNSNSIAGATNATLTLASAQPTNGGVYSVTVSNAYGSTNSSNAVLTVLVYPPTITTQPTNQTVYVGSTATFTAVAGGTPPLHYQWSFNTTNIVGATNATLTLANVQLTNAGNYSVLVTNAYGSTNSVNAVLTVNLPPPCDPPPSGLVAWWRAEGNAFDSIGTNNGTPVGNLGYTTGEVGEAFVFNNSTSYIPLPASPSLNLGTNGGLTIEFWVKPNAYNVNVTGAPIVEWDSSSSDGLSLWVGSGLFYMGVKDTSGVQHVIQSANGLIVDTNHFQHVAGTYDKGSGLAVLYLNGTAVVTNNFGSLTPQTTYPTYHLNIGRRTGQPIGNGDTYGGLMDELSLYTRALSASEVQAIYATGPGGKCVPTAPFIATQPTNQSAAIGSTATFTVTAGGTAPLSYRWRLNSTNIIGATNTTLALANVQLTNAGTYSVMVTNAYGSVISSNAVLKLGTPPSITNQPASQRVSLGCNVAFNVVAGGTAPLSYQWWKGNLILNGQTNTTISLTNVQTTDFTNYYVVVASSFGSVTSSNAVLSQNHPPVAVQDIIQRLANGDVKVQVSTLLANDTDADGDALTLLGVSTNSTAGGTVNWSGNWVYYLPPVGYTNSDAFTYIISDGYCGGTATGNVLVQVMTANGPSHNFTIYVQPDGSVRLVFAGIPGWTYRIQYADTLPPVNWTDLSTNTADSLGVYQFTDVPPTNSPSRFYRSVSP
jgi:hypothetical protein